MMDNYSTTFFNFCQMTNLSKQRDDLLEGLGRLRISTKLLAMASPAALGENAYGWFKPELGEAERGLLV